MNVTIKKDTTYETCHNDINIQKDLVDQLVRYGCYSTAEKLQNCLRVIGQYTCTCGNKKLAVHHRCMTKICPSCNSKRASILIEKYTPHIKKARNLRFVTLTMKNTKILNREILQQLKDDFKTLRLKILKDYDIQGGFYRTEITYNEKSKSWHPHIHALIDMNYIDQKILSEAWKKVRSDNSFIVGINRATKKNVNYILKYTLKPGKSMPLNVFLSATKGLRDVQPFGTWMKNGLKEEDYEKEDSEPVLNPETPEVVSLYAIATHWAKIGDKNYLEIKQEVDCECGKCYRLRTYSNFGNDLLARWIEYN